MKEGDKSVAVGVLALAAALFSASAAGGALLVAADQNGPKAVIIEDGVTNGWKWCWEPAKDARILPEYVVRFGNLDECKPIDGGRKILVNASGGAVAAVDVARTNVDWYAYVPKTTGAGPHSVAMLPDGRVAVAVSTGVDALFIVDLNGSPLDPAKQRNVRAMEVMGAHGVFWHEPRQSLFVLGYTNLFELAYSPADCSVAVKRKLDYRPVTGDPWGHDLVPDDDGGCHFTTGRGIWRYDYETAAVSRLMQIRNAKSFSRSPSEGDLLSLPREGWWTDRLTVISTNGEKRVIGPFPGSRFYKARWLR